MFLPTTYLSGEAQGAKTDNLFIRQSSALPSTRDRGGKGGQPTTYLIIGSGIAGLNFALNASKFGQVLIITKKKAANSNTNFAQGGIAAVMDQFDDPKKHIEDTLKAGAYHNKLTAVKLLVKEGPNAVMNLVAYGVPFAKNNQGELLLTREGGHSHRRIAFVGDYTGAAIEKTLIKKIKQNKNIQLIENCLALNLLVHKKVCYGAQVLTNKKIENIFTQNTVLATGGIGQLYKITTNPDISTGDGLALAYRAGCKFKDLEFIQFHPTALNLKGKPHFLLSEAMRGEGAILRNYKKEKFMTKYHQLGDLAPRDIVARAIYEEEKKGSVYLDITHEKPADIKKRFPQIYKKLLKFGVDITKDLIPISPAAHYLCGGVETNLKGETNIKNLYAFGEVAWTGVHGANRLASNSLLEALVFGNQILKTCEHANKRTCEQNNLKFEIRNLSLQPTTYLSGEVPQRGTKTDNLQPIKKSLQKIMWKYVGIIRTKKGLQTAFKLLNKLHLPPLTRGGPGRGSSSLAEFQNMLTSAILITKSALKRQKSLGGHYLSSSKS